MIKDDVMLFSGTEWQFLWHLNKPDTLGNGVLKKKTVNSWNAPEEPANDEEFD